MWISTNVFLNRWNSKQPSIECIANAAVWSVAPVAGLDAAKHRWRCAAAAHGPGPRRTASVVSVSRSVHSPTTRLGLAEPVQPCESPLNSFWSVFWHIFLYSLVLYFYYLMLPLPLLKFLLLLYFCVLLFIKNWRSLFTL